MSAEAPPPPNPNNFKTKATTAGTGGSGPSYDPNDTHWEITSTSSNHLNLKMKAVNRNPPANGGPSAGPPPNQVTPSTSTSSSSPAVGVEANAVQCKDLPSATEGTGGVKRKCDHLSNYGGEGAAKKATTATSSAPTAGATQGMIMMAPQGAANGNGGNPPPISGTPEVLRKFIDLLKTFDAPQGAPTSTSATGIPLPADSSAASSGSGVPPAVVAAAKERMMGILRTAVLNGHSIRPSSARPPPPPTWAGNLHPVMSNLHSIIPSSARPPLGPPGPPPPTWPTNSHPGQVPPQQIHQQPNFPGPPRVIMFVRRPPVATQGPAATATTSSGSATTGAQPGPPASAASAATSNWSIEDYISPPATRPASRETLPPPPVEAAAPTPPNWEEHYEETIMSLSTYKTFPVEASSKEFEAIAEMLAPFDVVSAEQVVNPDLWQRYKNTRTEMLRLKSEDLSLLKKLGFDEQEVQRRAYQSKNFAKDPRLDSEGATYSPNEVLLFHCTRSQGNVEKILNQGLDERLSAFNGGRLGKGIYFSDDPLKSFQYDGARGTILIFSVMLGDSLFIQDWRTQRLVREPEKEASQKRNPTDQFFDSVTARPIGTTNEYVIYNRGQCCPMYLVKYKVNPGPVAVSQEYFLARRNLPTIAWNPMPNPKADGGWPFFTAPMFKKMKMSLPEEAEEAVPEPVPVDSDEDAEVPDTHSPSGNNLQMDIGPSPSSKPGQIKTDLKDKIATIVNLLGIQDEARILEALEIKRYDLDEAVNYLLENNNGNGPTEKSPAATSRPSSSTSIKKDPAISSTSTSTAKPLFPPSTASRIREMLKSSSKNNEAEFKDTRLSPLDMSFYDDTDSRSRSPNSSSRSRSTPPLMEECTICFSEYMPVRHSPQLWKVLECGHKLCQSCYNNIEVHGTTMRGVQHTSVKCPFCQGITGTVVGTCPNGTMIFGKLPMNCAGYPDVGSIQIHYILDHEGRRYRRVAFLPDTPEGQQVLKMLETAWDLRLIFAVGVSNTSGAQNVPVWNIHHKTSPGGGVESHGYPDPGYLERVKWELKTFGIE